MNAMAKFLVPLTIFLSASYANAFLSLNSVARDQVRVNHLIQLQQPMSKPTNEPSRELFCKPTQRMDLDAKLPNNLLQINNAVLSNHSNQRVSFVQPDIDKEIKDPAIL